MPVPTDSTATFADYAHPDRLVSTEWLSAHLGTPGLRVVESDEDVLLYDVGHIPGAVKIDWHLDLNDPVTRDYIDGEQFSKLMSRKGISREDTIVVYGDKSNWWAAYALWVFTLFGHQDVRLLDGGRDAWLSENRDTTLDVPEFPATDYPVIERHDAPIRAFASDVLGSLGTVPLIDVRSPAEYTGERTHMPDYPRRRCSARRSYPHRREHSLGQGSRTGRTLPFSYGTGRDLLRYLRDRRRDRVLPYR